MFSPLQRHFDRYRSALKLAIDRVDIGASGIITEARFCSTLSNSAILNTIAWLRRGVLWCVGLETSQCP
jgi:hypothetical protein